jgi:hypothetical protein
MLRLAHVAASRMLLPGRVRDRDASRFEDSDLALEEGVPIDQAEEVAKKGDACVAQFLRRAQTKHEQGAVPLARCDHAERLPRSRLVRRVRQVENGHTVPRPKKLHGPCRRVRRRLALHKSSEVVIVCLLMY